MSHHVRARQLLKAHPEVKRLMTRNATTALITAGCVALQVAGGLRPARSGLVLDAGRLLPAGRVRMPHAVRDYSRGHPQPGI
ncbi:MAG: hypothetical protein WKG07_19800 [Hymenobacter sp.]